MGHLNQWKMLKMSVTLWIAFYRTIETSWWRSVLRLFSFLPSMKGFLQGNHWQMNIDEFCKSIIIALRIIHSERLLALSHRFEVLFKVLKEHRCGFAHRLACLWGSSRRSSDIPFCISVSRSAILSDGLPPTCHGCFNTIESFCTFVL